MHLIPIRPCEKCLQYRKIGVYIVLLKWTQKSISGFSSILELYSYVLSRRKSISCLIRVGFMRDIRRSVIKVNLDFKDPELRGAHFVPLTNSPVPSEKFNWYIISLSFHITIWVWKTVTSKDLNIECRYFIFVISSKLCSVSRSICRIIHLKIIHENLWFPCSSNISCCKYGWKMVIRICRLRTQSHNFWYLSR